MAGIPDRQTLFLGSAVFVAILVLGFLVIVNDDGQALPRRAEPSSYSLAQIPFDGQRSYQMLQQICALGSRTSGTPGMESQQRLLQQHFQQLGGNVSFQRFRIRHPVSGAAVELANLVVQWHPVRTERILLCAHYDTRPFPDRDPDRRKRRGLFIGANDGASGVAVLAEMGRHMPELESRYGVDFVLFDAEELVFDDRRDKYFWGSEYFARKYVTDPPVHRYHYGVLLDMVGDAYLQLYQERNSMRWQDTRPLVEQIWNVARQLGVSEFVPRKKHEVRDDHIPLHDIGRIPTCDIIDFDYRQRGTGRSLWHTTEDTPDKCSALSLAKVGWVVLEWLKTLK